MRPGLRIVALCVTLAAVVVTVAGLSMWVLYRAAFNEQNLRLVELAQSQARLMESIAEHFAAMDVHDSENVISETLKLVRASHARFEGFGDTGEFTLAHLKKGEIVFLLSHRHSDLDTPKPVRFDSDWAEPMRRALLDKSGTLIGLDYRGVDVLAAHEPVAGLGIGIVAKIDLEEIRRPFIEAGAIALIGSIFLVAVGAMLIIRVTSPFVEELKQAAELAKKSEIRLAGILETAPDAVIAIDGSQNIRLFNKGAERIFGFSQEEVSGRSLEILMPERFHEAHDKLVTEFDSSNETYRFMDQRQEIMGLRKDGTEFPASASVSKLIVGDEKFFTVVLQDTTERRRTEEERQRALSEAEKANRAKSDFLAAMSHELRTPLNAILGFADIIRYQYLGTVGNNRYVEYANDIHFSGEHLMSLVNDLLDISTIEAGKASLNKEFVLVGEIVEESLHIVAEQATRNGVALVANTENGLPPIKADKRAVRQILLNLLSNALKHTPQGGEIAVSVSGLAEGNTVVQVADTGIGIPPDRLADITAPFNRVEMDPQKAVDGWGLGLAITESLIALHDGKMEISSAEGKGTTVSVTLPGGNG